MNEEKMIAFITSLLLYGIYSLFAGLCLGSFIIKGERKSIIGLIMSLLFVVTFFFLLLKDKIDWSM